MNKSYKVLNTTTRTEDYTITVTESSKSGIAICTYKIYRRVDNNDWDELALEVVDHGNGLHIPNVEHYHEVTELLILLSFIRKYDSNLCDNYEIIDPDTVMLKV